MFINWKYNNKTNFAKIVKDSIMETEGDPIIYFRYEKDFFQPIVKFDKEKGLLYFLTERSFKGEIDIAEFETKGIKAFIS